MRHSVSDTKYKDKKETTPGVGVVFICKSQHAHKPNSVLVLIYLAPRLLSGSSGTPLDFSRDTALHSRRYLAVSAGLNRVVSVRNPMITQDGRYPLRFPSIALGMSVRTFLTKIAPRAILAQVRDMLAKTIIPRNLHCANEFLFPQFLGIIN